MALCMVAVMVLVRVSSTGGSHPPPPPPPKPSSFPPKSFDYYIQCLCVYNDRLALTIKLWLYLCIGAVNDTQKWA